MEMLGGYLLECVTHATDPLDRCFAEALGGCGAFVASGQLQWQRGDEWTERDSGDWIFHGAFDHHAMVSLETPLLTLVTWIDGLDDI